MQMIDVVKSLRTLRVEQHGRVRRLQPGTHVAMVKNMEQHDFVWHDRIWMCSKCMFRTHLPSSVSHSRSNCRSITPFINLIKNPRGHRVYSATIKGGGTFVYCANCFHYASPNPRRLLRACGGPAVAVSHNSSSKFYILRNQHPVSRLRLCRPCRVHSQAVGT